MCICICVYVYTCIYVCVHVYDSVYVYASEERRPAVGRDGSITQWLGSGSCAVEMGFKSKLEKFGLTRWFGIVAAAMFFFAFCCVTKDMLCRTHLNFRFQ